MNRHIEEIKRDIESEKEKVSVAQSNLVRLNKEFCEALSCEFTEDTGISEGDKFECTFTCKDFNGKERTSKYYGFFVGFRLSNWGSVSLVYADVKKDGSRSKNTHEICIDTRHTDYCYKKYEETQD